MAEGKTRQRVPTQATASTYQPTRLGQLRDFLVEAPVRQLARFRGADERGAYQEGNRVGRNANELAQLLGTLSLFTPGGLPTRTAAAARRAQPAVQNIIAWPTANAAGAVAPRLSAMVGGRTPATREAATYISRNMAPAELAAARQSGYFTAPQTATKFNAPGGVNKWWSPADDVGIFGRPWSRAGSETVRVPMTNYSATSPITTRAAQVRSNGEWVPFVPRKGG